MIDELERNRKEAIEEISRQLPGGANENHKILT
jgi:hypothetical protein